MDLFTYDYIIFILVSSLLLVLKFYMFILTIRVYLTWFPVINLYQFPWQGLRVATTWYLMLFRQILPPSHGIDLSPMLSFYFLMAVIKWVEGNLLI